MNSHGICYFLTLILRYECAVNIEELIKLEDVMVEPSLGPNGGEIFPS